MELVAFEATCGAIQMSSQEKPYLRKTFIHFYIPAYSNFGSQGSWSLSQLSLGERQGTATQGPCALTHTPRVNLVSPVNLTCMFLDGGRKPDRTHAYTGHATCKSTQKGFEPGTLLLCGANHRAALRITALH